MGKSVQVMSKLVQLMSKLVQLVSKLVQSMSKSVQVNPIFSLYINVLQHPKQETRNKEQERLVS